jgi:hypothetical protein
MVPRTIPRVARTNMATISNKAPDIQMMSSLQGDTNLLTSMMSISTIFYPFLNPISSPGTNPNIVAIGNPDAVIADGCAANCVAVLLSE